MILILTFFTFFAHKSNSRITKSVKGAIYGILILVPFLFFLPFLLQPSTSILLETLVFLIPIVLILYVILWPYFLESRRNFDAAIRHYDRLLRLLPNSASLLHSRAKFHIQNGDMARALADINRCIELNVKNTELYYTRIHINGALHKYKEIVDDYNKVLELLPNDVNILVSRSAAYYSLRDFTRAVEDCNLALTLPSATLGSNATAYSNRAFAYIHMGDYAEAIADFNRALAIRLSPQETIAIQQVARSGQGLIAFAQGNYAEALAVTKRTSDEQYTLAGVLAIVHHALGNIEEAKALWQTLIDKDHPHQNHLDFEWVKAEYIWPEAMAEEAQKLIALFE